MNLAQRLALWFVKRTFGDDLPPTFLGPERKLPDDVWRMRMATHGEQEAYGRFKVAWSTARTLPAFQAVMDFLHMRKLQIQADITRCPPADIEGLRVLHMQLGACDDLLLRLDRTTDLVRAEAEAKLEGQRREAAAKMDAQLRSQGRTADFMPPTADDAGLTSRAWAGTQ